MELDTLTNQVIALAGIAQAAALVNQLATTGKTDEFALQASLSSILKTDSDSVLEVYGNNLANLKLGLEHLNAQLTGYEIAYPDEARYAAALVFLERQFCEQKQMVRTVSIGIERARLQIEHFHVLHENVLANFGDMYLQTMSRLEPRIMVNGVPDILSRQDIANKIRACLLAGIRSAMLWRQCNGRRWKFLLFRKKIQTEVARLLALIESENR